MNTNERGWPEGVDDELTLRMQVPEPPRVSPFAVRALAVLWPSFFMAGVLEMLVFVVVDPAELRWFGGELLSWSSTAVYTVTFLIFWLVISLAGAMSALLVEPGVASANQGKRRLHWP